MHFSSIFAISIYNLEISNFISIHHQTTLNIFLNIVLLTRRLKIALRAIGCRFKEKKKKKSRQTILEAPPTPAPSAETLSRACASAAVIVYPARAISSNNTHERACIYTYRGGPIATLRKPAAEGVTAINRTRTCLDKRYCLRTWRRKHRGAVVAWAWKKKMFCQRLINSGSFASICFSIINNAKSVSFKTIR